MNERIRKLAERQGLTGPNFYISAQELEKFAELIVKECADIGDLYEGGEYQVRTQILAHFGVEK